MWHTVFTAGLPLTSKWRPKSECVRCGQPTAWRRCVREAPTQRRASSWAGPPPTVWPPSGIHIHTTTHKHTAQHKKVVDTQNEEHLSFIFQYDLNSIKQEQFIVISSYITSFSTSACIAWQLFMPRILNIFPKTPLWVTPVYFWKSTQCSEVQMLIIEGN